MPFEQIILAILSTTSPQTLPDVPSTDTIILLVMAIIYMGKQFVVFVKEYKGGHKDPGAPAYAASIQERLTALESLMESIQGSWEVAIRNQERMLLATGGISEINTSVRDMAKFQLPALQDAVKANGKQIGSNLGAVEKMVEKMDRMNGNARGAKQ